MYSFRWMMAQLPVGVSLPLVAIVTPGDDIVGWISRLPAILILSANNLQTKFNKLKIKRIYVKTGHVSSISHKFLFL